MDDGKGIGERFKITNTSKVTSNVSFSINAKEGDDPRAQNASDCFVVQPTQWEVPPHEHRYVTVYFHARELRENTEPCSWRRWRNKVKMPLVV